MSQCINAKILSSECYGGWNDPARECHSPADSSGNNSNRSPCKSKLFCAPHAKRQGQLCHRDEYWNDPAQAIHRRRSEGAGAGPPGRASGRQTLLSEDEARTTLTELQGEMR